ncbi:unnamed protein product [Rotaria magnacalcarata]|uniref:Uncharacterized protein n=1 Tax=Rotaria magnacalcarata TaxID=392030 RepID=A0A8S2LR67_9BILA|nr:unnamed protein product [Rotaria magnacalcarata]CAF3902828.1 unnamed protein product [Rotaria magnacalcarata]
MSGGSATLSDNMDTDNIRTDNRSTDNIRRDEEWIIGGIFRLQIQPLDFLMNQNYDMILFTDIHSKHEYFREQLQIETEQMNRLKNDLLHLKHYYRDDVKKDDIICQKCMLPVFDIDSDYIINRLLKNNLPIKKLYNDTLLPLQHVLILICLFNTICMTMIFEKPIKLFLISSLFGIICLFIHGEFFIEDKPNVYYTLIAAIGVFLFSVFLLIKILLTLLNIIYYHTMKNILRSE